MHIFEPKEALNTNIQKMHKLEPKKHLTLPYKNYGKKMQKFEQKKHLTLPQKNYAKKKI